MAKLDCLFVHVPKFENYYKPFGRFTCMHEIGPGVFGIADFLERSGMNVRIVNLALAANLGVHAALSGIIERYEPRVVALSLSFHHLSYDVIQVASMVKKLAPSCKIVLGGINASLFASEILENFPFIDAIVRGDGEGPMLRFLQVTRQPAPNFVEVPNLSWRQNGVIKHNVLDYQVRKEDMDNLCYSRFDLVDDFQDYIHLPAWRILTNPIFPERVGKKFAVKRDPGLTLSIPAGRGCMANCMYCGGNRNTEYLISGRKEPVLRSHDSMIADIENAYSYGVEHIGLFFCPSGETYSKELLQLLPRGLKIKLTLPSWEGLPSDELLRLVREKVDGESVIPISVESGSEKIRSKYTSKHFSNSQLMDYLERAEKHGVATNVYFCLGFPGETWQTLAATRDLQREIRKRFKYVRRISNSLLEIEPGAPWSRAPEAFGIIPTRRSFMDYYLDHGRGDTSRFSHIGYYRTEYLNRRFGDPESYRLFLLNIKCREFCHFVAHPSRPVICRASAFCRWLERKHKPHKGVDWYEGVQAARIN